MVRLAFRGAVGVLWAALATACLGGQTGQPDSLECGATQLSPTASWSRTTVQGAAQSFDGTYNSGLRWQVEARSATTNPPVDLQDSAQLTISYRGAPARRDCADQLEVPVSVTLTSSDSGLAESGQTTLTISRSSQGLVGELHFESPRIKLDATLPELGTGNPPLASFDALDPSLPGASASFTQEP